MQDTNHTMTYLRAGDAQEADRHEHTIDCDLVVAELDAVQVLYTQTIRRAETIESKDLVHLDGSHKRASSLADNVRDSDNVGKLGCERRSD